MTTKLVESKSVREFIEIAAEFCSLIENRDSFSYIRLLQKAMSVLPKLCLCGMKLPDIKRAPRYKPPRIPFQQWRDMFESLRQTFGDYDAYNFIFDPYDSDDKEPIKGSLAGDLSEIYQDLKPGLQQWEKVSTIEKRAIIWELRFGYGAHWGDHATRAFYALHPLLYNHIEDKYGDYVGISDINT